MKISKIYNQLLVEDIQSFKSVIDKLSDDELVKYKEAIGILKDKGLDEGIKDKLKNLGLTAAVIAALMLSPELSSAEKNPIKDLAKPESGKVVTKRVGTSIDGINGEYTSKFMFPPAFIKFLNTGDIKNLGLEGNSGLQQIAMENKLSPEEMYQWNNFVKWMKDNNISGNSKMNNKDFSLNVLKQYVEENPKFFIQPNEVNADGTFDKVKKIQNILKVYRAYAIKEWKLGRATITVGGEDLNPNDADVSNKLGGFMSWAI